ncbi:PAS domain-containing protein [Mastigocladopsis repens]|uniref:PAS domain-containing protein n=1 Tax=Mastigocladopsis repens TaxID=221287 RepID=UPI00031C5481|nr:PAS domain-containing protein [Mastigocladopsis repens]
MTQQATSLEEIFAGDSEMAALMRTFNWAQTPLGPVEYWSESLRLAVKILLAARTPMQILWGSEYIHFYNDSYRPILGAKHPKSLGQRGCECWQEVWDFTSLHLDRVRATGEASWSDDQLVLIDRNGYLEECYFTFSYTPVRDESGAVGGIFNTVNETTQRVIGERRHRMQGAFVAEVTKAKTAEEICAIAAEVLANNPADIPFALLYLLDSPKEQARLVETVRLEGDTLASSRFLDLTEEDHDLMLSRVALTGKPELVKLNTRFRVRTSEPWGKPPHSALVIPIAAPGLERPAGFLVAGINPCRPLDEDYRSFLEMMTSHIAIAVANVRAYEAGKQAEAIAGLEKAKTAFLGVLSARSGEELRVKGLQSGADDNLIKPFSTREEVARIDTNLKLSKLSEEMAHEQELCVEAETAYVEISDILESISDAFVAFDQQWRYTYINQEAARLLQKTREELLDQQIWDVFPDVVGTTFEREFRRAVAEQVTVDFEEFYQPYNISIEVRAYPSDKGLAVYFRDITQRKIAQEALRQSEERFAKLAENVPGVIYQYRRNPDDTDKFTYISSSWLNVFEIEPHLVQHNSSLAWQSVHPDDLAAFRDSINVHAYTGERWQHEFRIVTPSGKIKWIQGIARAQQQPDGAVLWDGILQDISERKFAEEALQQSEAKFRRTFECNMVAMGIWTRAGTILDANDALLNLIGYNRQELEAGVINWRQMTPPQSIHVDERALAEIQDKGIVTPFEKEYIHKDGRHIPVLIGGALFLDNSETGVFFAIDLTERKRAEEALRQSETLLNALLASAPIGIAFLDRDLRYIHVNEALAGINGLPLSEHLGRTLGEVLPQWAPEIAPILEQVMQTKEPLLNQEISGETNPPGVYRHSLVNYYPVCLPDSQVLGVGVTAIDVTELKRTQAQAQQLLEREQAARAEAESANRIKDEFLAVLSHELRSPLNPILGWAQMLRTRKYDEKATNRALETIERNAKLQAQLIEDLLDVSRILRGKLVLNDFPVNLVATIEAAIETVRLAAEAKTIQIQTILNTDVGVVLGDTNRLQQVVWNLLSNAVKFTPKGGRVEIRLERVGCFAQIQIRDTGKGINPEFLPYVFEYFRQENSSTTRQFGGLGLGLAIVRYLTEMHGGSVGVESAGEGQGATFTVRLPVTDSSQLQVLNPELNSDHTLTIQDAVLSGMRVLIVDDEADIRQLLAFILEESGAEVTIAGSAAEALVAFEQSVPDVLLSDIGMPDVDGYMLMRQIRALSPERGGQTLAIALTAYAGEYNQQQALAAGFQMHISKPVEPDELIKAIAPLRRAQSAIAQRAVRCTQSPA